MRKLKYTKEQILEAVEQVILLQIYVDFLI